VAIEFDNHFSDKRLALLGGGPIAGDHQPRATNWPAAYAQSWKTFESKL